MRITKQQIRELNPCSSGWKWYCEKERSEDLKELLLEINQVSSANARWLITRLMTKRQNVELAVYAARQVLYIYEESCTLDKPRKAIEAAEKWLKDSSNKNAADADAAAADAYAAAADAADAYAAAAAYAAADAADAADAGGYAADAADAAGYAAARRELQEKIITKAIALLEKGNE